MTNHKLTVYYIKLYLVTGTCKDKAKLFAAAMIAGKHDINHLNIKS
jgi:hypothetical protein